MIEATCSACGTLNRIAETDVPAGAKFVNCASCKSRVPLPGTATKPAIPTMPKLPTAVPAIPSIKPPPPKPAVPAAVKPPAIPSGPPPVAVPVPAPGAGKDILDLSDLPAPKRQSPLGAAPESKPAPRSGLSAALDADLPAPKAAPRSPSAAPPPSLDLDDLIGADLPAPKAKGSADLPAPKGVRPATAPTPTVPGGDADLPAPKPRSPITRAAAATPPQAQPSLLDLDLAPRTASAHEISDLPAPRAGLADLPMPKQARQPAPPPAQAPGGVIDLPAPKGSVDLPAPKGFFDDLPQPAKARPEQPGEIAPKGFFEDLPQPAKGQKSGSAQTVDIAPKGFFEDLPQPAKGQKSGPAQTVDVAPKGFFDDLPQPAKGQKSGPAPTDDVAPLGFFDDLPQAAKGQKPGPAPTDDLAPLGFFDDLPQPATLQPPAPIEQPRMKRDSRGAIDLGDDPIEPIDLASDSPGELELDLGAPSAPPSMSESSSSSSSFDDLDLSAPSAAPGARAQALDEDRAAGIKIGSPKTPTGAKAPERASLPSLGKMPAADEALELEEPRETLSLTQRLGPKPEKKKSAEVKPVRKPLNKKLVLGIVLGLAAGGAGGFYFYQRHAAQEQRLETIESELAKARKILSSDNPNRWALATTAANKVLELEPKNGAAAGIAAEASFAGALADGKNIDARFAQGRKKISDALSDAVTGPELDRAGALSALTTNPAVAVTKLEALRAKAPKDPSLALYLGWANAAAGKAPEAIKAFDAAADAPSTKALALLGRARVKLDQADVDGARADFNAVLVAQKDNIAAQVGLAAALPAAQTQQQESDLLAIIARKDFKDADPRARVLAFVLAGDAARRTSRTDAARERYRKALEIDKKAISATTSLAEVELADGKPDAARTLIDQALVQVKDHPPALLVKAELALADGKLDEADTILGDLEKHEPPLPTLLRVHAGLARGKLLEAKKQDDAAVDAYAAAAKLAGELDLAPTMAAITKLAVMANAAAEAKDTEREAALKARAEELLTALAAAAEKDPSLAFSLGVAYQQTGEAAQAEPWLQKVLAARPNDPDAMYQLALVQRALGRSDEALAMLEKARAAAPDRVELAIELARTYEALGKDIEAGALYAKLLTPPGDGAEADVPLELRVHAGLFFVRIQQLPKAAEQGKIIVKLDRDNATGHYLVAEGALAAGNNEDARREFTEAVTYERTARHLDGQGRANEAISVAKKDVAMQDAALRAYMDAIKLDPTIFSSQLGLGRLYVARKEMQKAVVPLLEANKLRANNWEVSYNLGAAYQRLGENKVALQWLAQSTRLKPTAEAYNLLGIMYSTEGVDDGRSAANSYGTAARLAVEESKATNAPLPPWYPDALYFWGRRSLDVGDEATARTAWTRWLATSPPPPASARRTEVERMLQTTLQR